MKKEECDECGKKEEVLFAGLCSDCFEELKERVGAHLLAEEETDCTVVRLPQCSSGGKKQKSVALFEKPINDWIKQVRVNAFAGIEGLDQVRMGLYLGHPDVQDVELIVEKTKKGIVIKVPKVMNYGQLQMSRVANQRGGGTRIDFRIPSPPVEPKICIPATHEKRLALAEKLRMDMMVEAKQELAGEVM